VRLVNLEEPTTTLTNDYDDFPVCSPRNDLIAFICKVDGNFEAFTIRPDGKDLKQLTLR
jgi:hypothetical protein